jgi:diacylglycerol O-acyltransferase / wax synthase
MSTAVPTRSMSATDAAFLYIERKEIPLNIASVCVFEEPIPFPEFVRSIDSKLHLVPRYRQIVVSPPWGLGFPSWQDDPKFDVHEHVFRVRLDAPGGDAELEAFASKLLSQSLDRSKPLWDLYVIDGLKEGRGALIFRVHHALADGIAGIELMKLLLDPTPQVPAVIPKPRYRHTRKKAEPGSLGDSISGMIHGTLGSLLEFEAGMLQFAQTLVAETKENSVKGLLGLLPEFSVAIERLPFNKPCTGERKFCWTEIDMADVQKVREVAGGTVNDVILAVVTRALARYVKLHGQSVVNRFVRIVCPVNLRAAAHKNDGLGNQISFLPVALPMDAKGPIRTLQAVTQRTETLKHCGALGFVGLAAKWLAAAPPPLQELFWRSIPEIILPVPALNMICTNVIGSPTPLYAVGKRMLAAYPQVPTGYDLGVGCAVHSYNGKLFFGLIADTHAAPDVDRLREFVTVSFAELRESAALKRARGAKRTRRSTGTDTQKVTTVSTADVASDTPGIEAKPSSAGKPRVAHSKEAA